MFKLSYIFGNLLVSEVITKANVQCSDEYMIPSFSPLQNTTAQRGSGAENGNVLLCIEPPESINFRLYYW